MLTIKDGKLNIEIYGDLKKQIDTVEYWKIAILELMTNGSRSTIDEGTLSHICDLLQSLSFDPEELIERLSKTV